MRQSPYIIRIFSFLFLALLWTPLEAKEVPPRPQRTIVNDYTNTLTANQQRALERKLVAYDDSTSTQIAVVMMNSTDGDDLFDYSYRIAEGWGIGRDGKDNGILLFIALQDRDVIIQTGYGVEGFLTDNMSRRIIDNIILPNFREGRYYQGLDEATTAIIQLGSGEYENNEGEGMPDIVLAFILLIMIVFVLVLVSRAGNDDDWDDDGGYYRRGRYDYDDYDDFGRTRRRPKRRRRGGGGWIVIPGGGGGGGWDGGGGGFGGGGFGGFGGGSFGGGGASGSW